MRPSGLLISPALLLLWNACCLLTIASASPYVSATAALVMDADTAEILYEKNMHLPLPIASTTKVMTGLLGVERLRPHELVRVSAYAAAMEPSKLYLQPGELIDAEDLLQAILLKSANDASAALAEKISGSEEAFARLMSRRAQELGARNTHFENASGLPAEGHYSTAYDLALIFRYAMQRPDFAEIMQLRTARVVTSDGRAWNIQSHNRLLWTFPGAVGGKTGWTRAAKHCYVGMAERGSRALVVSVLGSLRLWDDIRALLDYGFSDVDTPDTRLVLSSPTKLIPPPATTRPPQKADGFSDVDTPDTRLVLSSPTKLAPPPATTRVSQKAPAMSGGNESVYIVQVGAFRQRRLAELLRQKLRRRGYAAYVTSDGSRTARWYRVRVGEFETHGEARQLVGRLKHQLGLVGLVSMPD
jgi:serine-type D-Ala-D-Ala carboxypeptidase (penicillin-binding protein 5/6)